MLPSVSPRRAGHSPSVSRFFRPTLEFLERRDCPAMAPMLTFNAFDMGGNNNVYLSGTVADENPSTVMLNFTGNVTATRSPDSSGVFGFVMQASGLGQVSCQAMDSQGLVSALMTVNVASNAPTLSNVSITQGPGRMVIVTGKVTDEFPCSAVVRFSGAVNDQVTPNPDGTFSKAMQASDVGQVVVQAFDSWGQASNQVTGQVTNTAPLILNFTATQKFGNFWTFSGRVEDESAAGLVITFGGLDGLDGKTAVVQADGTFSVNFMLPCGDTGTATAQVTDWFGASSNLATALVQ